MIVLVVSLVLVWTTVVCACPDASPVAWSRPVRRSLVACDAVAGGLIRTAG